MNVQQAEVSIDPEIREFVRRMSAAYAAHGDFGRLTIGEQRRICEIVREPWRQGGPQMASTWETNVDGSAAPVRVRIYEPKPEAGAQPALIYLHGGGWSLFSLETHDRVMREYAHRAGVVVVGVDYALAPEAPFPAALEQIVTVVRWVRSGGVGKRVDPGKIAIGGDSAGGNLAVGAALKLRDCGHAAVLKALLLIYGAFDWQGDPEADAKFGGEGFMLTPEEREVFWQNYAPNPADRNSPYARPIIADLAELPPAMLLVGECDILVKENQRMCERFLKHGVPAQLCVYAGATHSFIEAMSISHVAQKALADSATWLQESLHTSPGSRS